MASRKEFGTIGYVVVLATQSVVVKPPREIASAKTEAIFVVT
jgi:hypothetical protein